MKRPTRRAAAALIVAVAVLLTASGSGWGPADGGAGGEAGDSEVLVFSGVPSKGSVTLLESWQPLLKMLKKETGGEIRVQNASDYGAVIEGMRTGEIDIAAFGPFSYVLAKDQGVPITAVAAQVQEKGETSPEYRSYGITWAGSPIKTIEDFRGKKVCFVDDKSASGYLYPSAGLLTVGIRPLEDTQESFVGSHDAAVLAVANKQCDAGFAFDTMVERQMIDQGKIQPGQIVTVWKSEPIPDGPIAIANDLPFQLRQQLTTAIQEKANADYQRAEGFCQGECPVGDAEAYGYAPVGDAFYDTVRSVCRLTQHESCKS